MCATTLTGLSSFEVDLRAQVSLTPDMDVCIIAYIMQTSMHQRTAISPQHRLRAFKHANHGSPDRLCQTTFSIQTAFIHYSTGLHHPPYVAMERYIVCCFFSLSGPVTDILVGDDTIRYDSVYLTCNKKLTGSQLSLPHGTNKKLKCKTKNKMMSVIGPVQSRYREAVQ